MTERRGERGRGRKSASGRWGALAFLASVLGAAACGTPAKPKPAAPPPPPPAPVVCRYDTRGLWAPGEMRDLATPTWLELMLPGFKVATGELVRPPVNCTGQPVRWSHVASPDCPVLEKEQAYLPPATSLGPQDLVIASSSQYTRLVWAITDRLSDGEAEGPVALAEFRPTGVEIRALGTLRALPERAHLRIIKVQGQTVLVAEGEHCEASDGTRCFRGTRLMLLVDTRFEAQPLRLEDGRCLEAAFFSTEHTQAVTGRDGLKRAMTATGRLDFAPDGIFLHEEVAVRNLEPGASGPGRLLREARSDRRLRIQAGRFYVSDGALWERMLQEW